MTDEAIPEPTRKNIQAIRDLEHEVANRRTRIDRLTDAVSAFVGSFRFLLFQLSLVVAWSLVNVGIVSGMVVFDPFPFEFLNFLVGVEAILLSTFVLMTQNRQNKLSEQWGHIQLQVGLLAEQETTKMLQMLRLICARLGLDSAVGDKELAEMIQTTHVEELARALEKARQEPPPGTGNETASREGSPPSLLDRS